MPKPIPEYLKLHTEPSKHDTTEPALVELGSVEQLCQAFERATGWSLRYEPPQAHKFKANGAAPRDNGAGLLLTPARRQDEDPRPRTPRQLVEPLAASIAILLGELDRTRHALWEREAELAAGVPIARRDDEEAHLALRLEAALAAGCDSVGGQAAALYLLDETTSQLKLRACVGLPSSKLLEPARPLRGAIADLEALIGHAVVIEDTSLLPHWRCPEDFPAAICVPVSSPSTPLGTLWIFSTQPRDFTSEQTNVVELVAGRIAADLERELLLSAGMKTRTIERDLDQAARWQEERLPAIAPLVDDWDVAGATTAGGKLAKEFFDWSVLPDGQLSVAVGAAHGQSVIAGLSATALQSALKSHGNYRHNAQQMLERMNETFWSGSPGGQYASLSYGIISPDKQELQLASAGNMGALLVHPDGFVSLSRPASPLGGDLETRYLAHSHILPSGGVLILMSGGVQLADDGRGHVWDEAAIAELVRRLRHLSAHDLVARLQHTMQSAGRDWTLLAVKRIR